MRFCPGCGRFGTLISTGSCRCTIEEKLSCLHFITSRCVHLRICTCRRCSNSSFLTCRMRGRLTRILESRTASLRSITVTRGRVTRVRGVRTCISYYLYFFSRVHRTVGFQLTSTSACLTSLSGRVGRRACRCGELISSRCFSRLASIFQFRRLVSRPYGQEVASTSRLHWVRRL